MSKAEDEKYMWRCIQLARNGLCTVSPNPMVGAVIVYEGKIIGEGYHIRSGEGHAEVNAVRSVKDKSLLKHSTLYVSLEPCSHYGKTPPCALMIVEKHIPRVVIGCKDPSEKVNGRGIRILEEAGIEVTTGILEDECKRLLKRFYTANILHRPYVTLKWAESADGLIGTKEGHTLISTPYTMMLAHQRRAENDAIMVGTTTAEKDNPQLNIRHWYGKNPLRIVLDRNLTLPNTLHLFDGSIRTLVFTLKEHRCTQEVEYVTLPPENFTLTNILGELADRGVQSLLVEGGAKLHQSFIDNDLWDEAFVERGHVLLMEGTPAACLKQIQRQEELRFFDTLICHYFHFKT